MHSPSFPPTGPRSDASLPSTRSERLSCPRFLGTIKTLRLPAAHPATLRCLCLAVPRGASCLSLPSPKTQRWRAGGSSGTATPTDAALAGGDGRISQVPGRPPVPIRSCSSTPAGRHAPYRNGASARPPLRERRGLLHWDFRGSIAGLFGSLSTLRRAGRPAATPDALPGVG